MEFSYIRHRCPAFGIITLKESSNEGKILGHNDERERDNVFIDSKKKVLQDIHRGEVNPAY